MKRIKLRRRKHKKINKIILIIILIIVTLFIAFSYISNRVTPIIVSYAEKQAKKIASIVINQAVDEELTNSFNSDELFTTNDNETDYNTAILSKLIMKVGINVRNYLKKLEMGELKDLGLSDNSFFEIDEDKLKNGVIYQVPSGIIFSNGFLSNLGPKIPVKLNFIGDITTEIVTDIKDYGINNAVIQISLNIIVNEQVILPFAYNQITVETNIPIAIKIIKGDIPNYYINGLTPYAISSN